MAIFAAGNRRSFNVIRQGRRAGPAGDAKHKADSGNWVATALRASASRSPASTCSYPTALASRSTLDKTPVGDYRLRLAMSKRCAAARGPPMLILGAYDRHDASAAVFRDYRLVAAVALERLTRI